MKAGNELLISDKINFRVKNTIKNKNDHLRMIKGSRRCNHSKYVLPNNSFKIHESKTDRTKQKCTNLKLYSEMLLILNN